MRRRLLLISFNVLVVLAVLTTTLLGPLPISAASAHARTDQQSSAIPHLPQAPRVAFPFSTAMQAGAATNTCALYPIGLGNTSLAGVAVGGTVNNVAFGLQPTNFGWMSWTGDRTEATLLTSLTPPGNSSTYVNPSNSSDHTLVPGDQIFGRPLAPDDSSMNSKLKNLEALTIIVPVFDQASQNGDVRLYRAIGFASIQLTGFNLLNSNTISFTYQGNVTCTASQSGYSLTLAPRAAGPDVTGASQTVQATLQDRARNPINGVSVTFTVTGANAATSSVTTNNVGIASLTYQGTVSGTDTIQASATVVGPRSPRTRQR